MQHRSEKADPRDEARAILALMMTPGLGKATIHRMIRIARSAGMSAAGLAGLKPWSLVEVLHGLPGDAVAGLIKARTHATDQAGDLLRRIERIGGRAAPFMAADFPNGLSRSLGLQAPPLLFLRGDPSIARAACASVVGARRVSTRGRRIAKHCAGTFAGIGAPVVSGGAQGVDMAAHAAALKEGGMTIVVLPQGLLTYHAPWTIEKAIGDGRALLVSEFVPDAGWETHAAVQRNATISALSRLVCVIEPKKTGGSIRTARCALRQGKRVLVSWAWRHRQAGRGLVDAGAYPLLDGRARFAADRLIEFWNAGPPPRKGQTELF